MAQGSCKLKFSPGPGRLIDFTRSDLRAAVNAGITASPGLPEEARAAVLHMAETADRVDASTWMVKDSCGCPMTKIGKVTIVAQDSEGGSDRVPSPEQAFAAGYDTAVTTRLRADGNDPRYGGGAVTLDIVDDLPGAGARG